MRGGEIAAGGSGAQAAVVSGWVSLPPMLLQEGPNMPSLDTWMKEEKGGWREKDREIGERWIG